MVVGQGSGQAGGTSLSFVVTAVALGIVVLVGVLWFVHGAT
jgi:hypothetical protein